MFMGYRNGGCWTAFLSLHSYFEHAWDATLLSVRRGFIGRGSLHAFTRRARLVRQLCRLSHARAHHRGRLYHVQWAVGIRKALLTPLSGYSGTTLQSRNRPNQTDCLLPTSAVFGGAWEGNALRRERKTNGRAPRVAGLWLKHTLRTG